MHYKRGAFKVSRFFMSLLIKKLYLKAMNFEHPPNGKIIKSIPINGSNYEVVYQLDKRITITIRPKNSLISNTRSSEIRKLQFISAFMRAPQYGLQGEKTELTEKLLLNQYTRALLYFRASKIIYNNNQISYTATLKKKDGHHVETIINYFKELLISLN